MQSPVPATAHPDREIAAVLLDFHGTIAQVEPGLDWVRLAAHACGVRLTSAEADRLARRYVLAGRAGGPPPQEIPPALCQVFAERDLTAQLHRHAYVGLAETVRSGVPGLAEALYERVLIPDGWRVYPDTIPTLRALAETGIPVAIVSNIAFDIRVIGKALGFAHYVRAWLLSYEVGVMKPDRRIFELACAELGVTPSQALMVGDTAADAGAVAAGCRTLLLPASSPEHANGLEAVLRLVGVASDLDAPGRDPKHRAVGEVIVQSDHGA